jgi:hypothetical protein
MPDSEKTIEAAEDVPANPPKNEIELTGRLDSIAAREYFEFQHVVAEAYTYARTTKDATFEKVARAEGIAFELFWSPNDIGASIGDPASVLDEKDQAYLEQRRLETSNLRLRAMYAHIVAWSSKRHDAGIRAAEIYANAIDHYLAVYDQDPAASEAVLRNIAPLALTTAKRYRRSGLGIESLIRAAQKAKAVLRLQVLKLLVPEKLEGHQRITLRPLFFSTINDLAGTSLLNEMIEAGRLGVRFDAKAGQNDSTSWNEALLAGLRKTVESGEQPILRERAAQQAALILQRLGAEEERAEMLRIQRTLADETRQSMRAHGEPVDADGSFARYVRASLDNMLSEYGELGVLTYLGVSPNLTPRVAHARQALAQQRAQGIGVIRQIVTTQVRASDNRIIGHASPGEENEERALWQQFGFECVFTWYAMDVAAQSHIATGTIASEHFESLLRQSWLVEPEATVPYNDLVELLMPPVRLYVDVITGDQPRDTLVGIIDSLTLRFEAILRKYARLNGIPDTIEVPDEKGRLATELRGLNILDDPAFSAVLGEDLCALIKQTLTGGAEGMRDSVGHAALHIEDYTLFAAHSLVKLLLRLASLQFRASDDEPET